MAVQILPNTGMGKNLGDALGSGIKQALGMLAQQKLQNMLRTQGAPGLEGLGFSPEQAQNVSLLDPMVQREVVKQRMQAPQQQAFAQALSGILGEQQPAGSLAGLASEEQQMLPQVATPETKLSPQMPTNLTAQQATQLAQLGLKKQALEQRKEEALSKMEAKKQEAVESRVKPYIEDIQKKGTAGKEDFDRLQEMEEIVKKGDITNPVSASILESLSKGIFGLGLDLFGLTSKDTQRFRKLSKDFAKTAKSYFGSRVTEGEIRLLLDTFPSLSQSREGQLAIIDRLKPLANAQTLREKALNDIIEENKFKTPSNIKALVEKRVKPELDKLAKEFKEKAQSRDISHEMKMKSLYNQNVGNKVKQGFRSVIPGTEEFLLKF